MRAASNHFSPEAEKSLRRPRLFAFFPPRSARRYTYIYIYITGAAGVFRARKHFGPMYARLRGKCIARKYLALSPPFFFFSPASLCVSHASYIYTRRTYIRAHLPPRADTERVAFPRLRAGNVNISLFARIHVAPRACTLFRRKLRGIPAALKCAWYDRR